MERTTETLDWWAREIWTIESEWRPCGLQAVLTFGFWPYPGGDGWWEVRCTDAMSDRQVIVEVSLSHWDKNSIKLIENLKRFRDIVADPT